VSPTLGRARARDLVRRRRLAECLFSTALHVTDPAAEETACRMEHIIDPEVTNSICEFLGHPLACPHGRPIPRGSCCDLPILPSPAIRWAPQSRHEAVSAPGRPSPARRPA
jgi:Mn-dependent DtxR family transcriptional regulator